MRIVNREEFMKLPHNTLYFEYEPCNFGPLFIKGRTIRDMEGNRNIDWFYQQLSGAVDCDNSGEFVDILQRAKETGESFGLDLNCEDKDGYFDYNQFYAVWDKEDVSQLVEKLKECL